MNTPRILVVLGHGRRESLCHRIGSTLRETLEAGGAELRVQDLLADGFDPVLRLPPGARHALPEHASPLGRQYQEDVLWMNALVIVHPVWWFGPPAILKGWVDQVLVDTVAIRQETPRSPKPLLKGRRALLIQTFNASRSIDRILMRKMSEMFWRRAVFLSVGILRVRRLAFHGVDGISRRNLENMDRKVAAAARALLPRGSG